jgi:predicted dehydrogenase
MDRVYGVGIVGFGWMGKTNAYAYRNLPFYYRQLPLKTKLIGVCVRRAETIQPAIDMAGFEFGTTNFDDLLQRDDIQIINVCTPNDLHKDQIIAAIKAGKHVYCDKPLLLNHDEGRQVLDVIQTHGKGLVTQMAVQYRYIPATMRAKQIIDEGRLGKILSFRTAFLHASLVDPNRPAGWRLRPGTGGGTLYDMGSHLLDLLTHLLGQPKSIITQTCTFTPQRIDAATGKTMEVQADDLALMLLQMKNGFVGSAEISKVATGVNDDLRMEIHGEKGALRFALSNPNILEYFDGTAPEEPLGGTRGFVRIETAGKYQTPVGNAFVPKLSIGWFTAHVACLYNFLSAVAGTSKPAPDFAEAIELQRLLDLGYESASRQAWISL